VVAPASGADIAAVGAEVAAVLATSRKSSI